MPEFVGVTPECRVQLEWRSLTACPPPAPKPATKDCTYIDEERGLKFKLGTLRKDGYGYFVSERIGYNYITYMLNVCDHCGGCSEKNSAVCLQSMGKAVSFGRADKGFFLYRDGMLKLRYEGGDECEVGEGDRATEIWFECDPTADDQNAKPELYESYGCLVILKWKTTLVCLDGPNPNLHSRKGRGGTTGIFLSLVALVGLIIVVAWFVKHGKAKRRSTASIITRPSSCASDSGIRLRTRPRSRMDGFHSLFGSLRGRLLGFGSSGSRDTYSYRIVEGNDAELDRRDSGDSSDDALCRLTAVSPGTNYQLIASDRALVPLQEGCGPDLLVLDSEGNEPQMRRKPDLVSNQASPTFVVAEDDSDDDDELLQF
ncbi:unnamed protein product [Notodromas monacha]|uniref:MRH domain-containing protein n=1 Tax=Notodromas monacha TaxID=399045 RepID=A0A7R9C096_9CRUS|nr:unnamed protein product [Notodromas monacha]CAG0923809.1 unnamed protein product [Notodromas monacha]